MSADATGPAGLQQPHGGLDIISGALLARPNELETRIRLAGPINREQLGKGYRYSFQFRLAGGEEPASFEVVASVTATSESFSAYSDGTGIGQYIKGVFDEARAEVRMTVDGATLEELRPAGQTDLTGRRIDGLSIRTGTVVGEAGYGAVTVDGDDEARSSRVVRAAARCGG